MGSWGVAMRESDYGLELLESIKEKQLKKFSLRNIGYIARGLMRKTGRNVCCIFRPSTKRCKITHSGKSGGHNET